MAEPVSTEWPPYWPQEIEPRWQSVWEEKGLYEARLQDERPKYYCLDFFPYPSGEGLHVGHCRNYVPTDVISRYRRMRGFNVLHPMGWDSFGEPTEQHAIAHGVHPRITTDRNTANFRRQMKSLGTSYDWSREIDSSDPDFYRWTQWFFLLLYRRGLAYRDTNWQWWCPTCQTTLSSHEAAGGVCWRGHPGVIRKEIPAWYFKITDYADELLDGLDSIDWPEPIKLMQRNWIGRSAGWEVTFDTPRGDRIPVFTTRPDTLYGVTFLVLAPEHPQVEPLTTDEQGDRVRAYVRQAVHQSELERTSDSGPPSGVPTGGYVVHPLTEEQVPVWVADYVMMTYGTGAVMGVPAHDVRDHAFARRYELPVRPVVRPAEPEGHPQGEAYVGDGIQINSGPFNGLPNTEAGERIGALLEGQRIGRRKVQYRLHDWLISRQRYWGAPIPIVHCEVCGEVPVPEEALPVLLPEMEDFTPDGTGRAPLARVGSFVATTCPTCDGPARRETDTMGGFACSSWYFLRFTSPHHEDGPFEPEAMQYWMPVDVYVGGAEHATLHLLYARFWTRVMYDAGLVPFREPFQQLLNQGILHGEDGYRMSKSRGNVITPDDVIAEYGADSLRVFELFMAPFDQDVRWTTQGINGAWRFLKRVWSLFAETYEQSAQASQEDPELERLLHRTLRETTERMEDLRFNTLVSGLMEFVNELNGRRHMDAWQSATYHRALDVLPILLAPIAPHIADELWLRIRGQGSVHEQEWPTWNEELARAEEVELPVQVDGKVRDVIRTPVDASETEIEERARSSETVQAHLAARQVVQVVYVPGRVLNFVTHPADRQGEPDPAGAE